MSPELRAALLALIDRWTENGAAIREHARHSKNVVGFIRMHATADTMHAATCELVALLSDAAE
jgi:hypothetical protein